MNTNYFISAFGTFGNPNGFQQSYWFTSDRTVVRNIETFDLNTNAIKLFPGSQVYALRKELAGSKKMISYSIYSYAKEQNSDRRGTFIGSSILFINKIAEENITIHCLNEFHQYLTSKNVKNDTLMVKHSDKFVVIKPSDFDKINFHLREVEELDFVQTTKKKLVVYCETNPSKLQSFLKRSVDLLQVYDTIYFTDNAEVAEFVHQKHIFNLVQKDSFEDELQKLAVERMRKREVCLQAFALEKERMERDRQWAIEEYKNQLDLNEKKHQENKDIIERSRKRHTQINKKYDLYAKKIEESINRLHAGEKLEDVQELHNENKRIFIDSIKNQEDTYFLNSVSELHAKTALQAPPRPLYAKSAYKDSYGQDDQPIQPIVGFNVYKVTTFILVLLWAGTLAYFIYFASPQQEVQSINQDPVEQLEQLPVVKDTVDKASKK